MPTLEYFVVCRSVSTDLNTDEITLSNVIEDVYLQDREVIVLPRAVAVCSWNIEEGDSTDYQVLLRITVPGQLPIPFAVNLEKGRFRHRAVIAVHGIPAGIPGIMTFEMLLNGRHEATHRVIVHPPGARILDTPTSTLNTDAS